jgi:hypothetical protein
MALKWLGDTSGNDNKDRLIASYKVNGVSFDSSQIVVNTTSNTFTITNHGLVMVTKLV